MYSIYLYKLSEDELLLDFVVYSFWCVVCSLYFGVSGLWFVVCGFWFLVSGLCVYTLIEDQRSKIGDFTSLH